eukprot:Skav230520  [mRNA]  locus=scaffold4943:108128:111329:- [translate_table: standard]
MDHLLYVVVDAIQDGTLVDHVHSQLLEDAVQICDGAGDVVDLGIADVGALLHLLQLQQLHFTEDRGACPFGVADAAIRAWRTTEATFLLVLQVVLL